MTIIHFEAIYISGLKVIIYTFIYGVNIEYYYNFNFS